MENREGSEQGQDSEEKHRLDRPDSNGVIIHIVFRIDQVNDAGDHADVIRYAIRIGHLKMPGWSVLNGKLCIGMANHAIGIPNHKSQHITGSKEVVLGESYVPFENGSGVASVHAIGRVGVDSRCTDVANITSCIQIIPHIPSETERKVVAVYSHGSES